ncbi:MAG: hypothetical protein JNM56_32515 [Planctomycetia bacterium]|nr:hypothetical protein [Planctomycetia bacterium]
MEDVYDEEPLSWYQAETLRRLLPPETPIDHLNRFEAMCLIRLHSPHAKWRDRPPTDKQRSFLERFERWRVGLSRAEAAQLIDEILTYAAQLPGGLPRLESDITDAIIHREKHPVDRWKEAEARSRAAAPVKAEFTVDGNATPGRVEPEP